MDSRRFKEIFLPCARSIYWAAFRLTGNTAEAEDLVQDTFLKLWMNRQKMSDIDNAAAYAVQTMRHLYFNRSRKQQPSETDMAKMEIVAADNLEREIELRSDSQRVMHIISQLPEQQRQIVTLRDVDDMSYDDIAQQTGLSLVNIRVTLSRARKAIRDRFTKNR